jgi:hypothetical protein
MGVSHDEIGKVQFQEGVGVSDFNLHDAIGPHLEQLGFVKKGKQFRGRSGDVVMTLYFNPESRLKRMRTVSIDCMTEGHPADILYQFDQLRAATGSPQAGYDRPGFPGWPEVMAEHFHTVTMPFIRHATSFDAIVDGILSGRFPPDAGSPYPMGAVIEAYSIADRLATTPGTAEVLAFAREQRFDWLEYRTLRDWAALRGVPLELQTPPFSLRGAVDQWLPLRYRRYTPLRTRARGES